MCFQLCVCVFSWRLGSGVRGPGSEGGVAKVWGMLLDMLACFFSCREAGMGRGAAPPRPRNARRQMCLSFLDALGV